MSLRLIRKDTHYHNLLLNTLTVNSNATIGGGLRIRKDLRVDGNASVGKDLLVEGNITGNALNIQGNSELCGEVHVCGNLFVEKAIRMPRVIVGDNAESNNDSSTALGVYSKADATASTALGATSKALGIASTSVGYGSSAFGYASTALGTFSYATTSAKNGIAIGYGATVDANIIAFGSGDAPLNVVDADLMNSVTKQLEVKVNGVNYYIDLRPVP